MLYPTIILHELKIQTSVIQLKPKCFRLTNLTSRIWSRGIANCYMSEPWFRCRTLNVPEIHSRRIQADSRRIQGRFKHSLSTVGPRIAPNSNCTVSRLHLLTPMSLQYVGNKRLARTSKLRFRYRSNCLLLLQRCCHHCPWWPPPATPSSAKFVISWVPIIS